VIEFINEVVQTHPYNEPLKIHTGRKPPMEAEFVGILITLQFEKGGPSVLKGKAPQPPEESNSVEVTIRPPDFEEKLKDFKFKIRIVAFSI